MRIRAIELAVSTIVLSAVGACGLPADASLWDEGSIPKVERFVRAEQWDTVWSIGSAQDTTLLRPRMLLPSREGVYVFDDIAQRLLALGLDGRVRWVYGSKGAGPDEFSNVRDLKLAVDGSLLVLDPANSRITVLERNGGVRTRIPLTQVTHAEQMVPLPGGRILLSTMDMHDPLLIIDATGAPVQRTTVPWVEFTSLNPLARQTIIAASPDGRSWAIGFVLGNGWFAYDGTRALPFTGSWAEHSPFPKVVTKQSGDRKVTRMAYYSPCSACSLSLSDTSVYVHFGGVSPKRKRLVDTHVLRTGRYTGTYVLPARAVTVAVRGDSFYVLLNEPYPRLLALRPIAGQKIASASLTAPH